MPRFDFDTEIDRRAVPALKTHRIVLGEDGGHLFPGGVADMDFPAAPCIQQAIAKRAAHGVYGYEALPDGLIPALTAWMQRRHGWTVAPEHVLRAPNVLNALAMTANTFTEPGDGIIIQPPVFFDFADIIRENGRRIVEAPLRVEAGRYEMDFEALAVAARDSGTRMLFLCNPHNPVGRVWTRDELRRLGQICRDGDVLVVADEIHADITFPGHRYTPFASLSDADAANSVTCLSPAKSFNLAACCSAFAVISNDAMRDRLHAANSALTVNKNNAFANVAMEAAWREGDAWLDAAIDYIAGNLALVRARLTDTPVGVVQPEGTFLLWLDFRALGLAPGELHLWLRQEAGWAITRGLSFGAPGAGFGRLNIACPRPRLARALDRLCTAMNCRKDPEKGRHA